LAVSLSIFPSSASWPKVIISFLNLVKIIVDSLGLYGTKSCGYYTQACVANGGWYECKATRICSTFPSTNRFDCIRQCLQEKHRERMPNQNTCSVDNNISYTDNATDHAFCWSRCMVNPENPYDIFGPDLPDSDIRLY
jgi:hypothetical protein